jgi:hypothetical protein
MKFAFISNCLSYFSLLSIFGVFLLTISIVFLFSVDIRAQKCIFEQYINVNVHSLVFRKFLSAARCTLRCNYPSSLLETRRIAVPSLVV